jgi:TonB family protein
VTELRIRIRRDGTIMSREIVASSGNPAMDETVQRDAAKVLKIDPLPQGITSDPYTVTIKFKLDQN